MFATWKSSKDDSVAFSTQGDSFNLINSRTNCPKACDRCRDKKVKCSGELSGCQNCRARGHDCRYVNSAKKQKVSQASDNFDSTTESRASATASTRSTSLSRADEQYNQLGENGSSIDDLLAKLPKPFDDFTWTMGMPLDMSINMPLSVSCDDDTLYQVDSHASSVVVGDTSTKGSGAGSIPSETSSSADCQCLYGVMMMMDRLPGQHEKMVQDRTPTSLLNLQKEALGLGRNMAVCLSCTGRVENVMALAILLDKLAHLSHFVLLTTKRTTYPSPTITLSPGEYQLDTEEYIALVRTLVRMQLVRLQALLKSLQDISLKSEALSRRLATCVELVAASLDVL